MGLDDHVLPPSNENSTLPTVVLADAAMYAVPAGILSDGVKCSAGSEPLLVPTIVQRTISPALSLTAGSSGTSFSPPPATLTTVAPLRWRLTSGFADAVSVVSTSAAAQAKIPALTTRIEIPSSF